MFRYKLNEEESNLGHNPYLVCANFHLYLWIMLSVNTGLSLSLLSANPTK